MKRVNKNKLVVVCVLSFFTAGLSISVTMADTTANQVKARKDRLVKNHTVIKPRIVGGENAKKGRWDWAAAIAFDDSDGGLFQYCGGTLVSSEWVLTAAHCDVLVGDKVILGRLDLTKSDGEVKEVIKVVYPKDVGLPAFNEDTNNHDLALIKLSSRSALKPVPLIGASNKLSKPGTAATVIGWGLLEDSGEDTSDVLMQVTVPIISNDSCNAYYNLGGISLTDNMICAGINGKDSCQGDSGGGIFATDQQTGKDHIVGIVSFGIGCALPEFPGVYTRVANYTQWIVTVIGLNGGF